MATKTLEKHGASAGSRPKSARLGDLDLTDESNAFLTHEIDQTDGPETVRVRMTVDLVGPLAGKLEQTAKQLGKSKTDVIRDGLQYVFRALKAQHDGFLVGAWKEDEDGRISRAREFSIGS
ncbi:hypothetical protein [Bradyrhizobium sp. CCGUVB14]|uniref:hypothetical protein n=1 Tax=Bradyrhizobium sp. CCGUVB14 TaxID=2949628 RepID=UPI0020B21ED5|nr:hypothetical protein [Bradyrhizobium sp. CCGUVB14]MCP3447205.1 hypothetical protein [Bradyrhizobium sp. CCGUVB14]